MGFSFASNTSSSSALVLRGRFLLLVVFVAGIAMFAFFPRAAEAKGDTVVSWDCTDAGRFPDSGYEESVKEALSFLEENTHLPDYSSLEVHYPLGKPRVYARSYCYAEPCKQCLRHAAKALLYYCPKKIFGSVKLVSCSLYYANGPF